MIKATLGAKLTTLFSFRFIRFTLVSAHLTYLLHNIPVWANSTKTLDAKKFKYNEDKHVKLCSPAHQKYSGMPAAY